MISEDPNMLRDYIQRQESFNKTILDEVHTIKRGLYGDTINSVKGLVDRQNDDERERADMKKDITMLKGFRARMIWSGAGFLAAIQGVYEFIKWKAR